jgi:hypothetical protein
VARGVRCRELFGDPGGVRTSPGLAKTPGGPDNGNTYLLSGRA